jgi:lathosterol oxidase
MEFATNCVFNCLIAVIIYLIGGSTLHYLFPRNVKRNIYTEDTKLGIYSLLVGTPMLETIIYFDNIYHFTKIYRNINDYSFVYYSFSIILYLLLWDLVFYLTHRLLHTDFIYKFSHYKHHQFRPPTAWAGISIDFLETILSGIMPYIVPVFIIPFHLYTLYPVNMILIFWALMLHSSCKINNGSILLSPKNHNLHHAYGQQNKNFSAIFTIFDRLFGTFDSSEPFWYKNE